MPEAEEGLPYRELAMLYDELAGRTAFECWRENFERLVNRYGVPLGVAADIACGTGLAVQYLVAKCSRVYAVDRSMWMLAVARERVSDHNAVFLEQSFTDLALPEQVDLLTCNFDSLNYLLEADALRETFRRFAASLRRGGHAVFDMNTTRELQFGCGTQTFVHRVSNGLSLWESDWDEQARINTLRMTNLLRRPDGFYELSEEVHRERSYDLEEITAMLAEAGFGWVEVFDARGLARVTEDTRRVQCIARR